jgi:hypothetical protein
MEPQEDDLYPTDSTFFGVPTEPQDQINARKRERGQTLAAAKEIQKVVKHFEERIKFRDTLRAINVDLKQDPALHQKVCEVNYMLQLALEEEKQLLEELLDAHGIN